MNNYSSVYKRISAPFRTHIRFLQISSSVLTGIMYAAYPILLIYLISIQSAQLLKTILIPAVSFSLLSLIRNQLNSPRPYEDPEIHSLLTKDTKGNSMPSRHIFSSSLISMAFFQVSPILAVILLIVSFLNACVRVIGGIHYPKDVIAGYIIGVICGMLILI